MSRVPFAALLPLAAVACTDFATPNQLEKPLIVAVVSDPPVVRPGGTARLTVVVADATGVLAAPPTTWAVTETYPGVAPMGTIAGDAGGATYTAPTTVPDRGDIPPIDTVTVTVDTAAGPQSALKAMGVVDVASANPTLTGFTVAGADALAGATVTRGSTVPLQITTDPPPTDDARFAWYTPVGDIKYYQSNPCDLVVPDDATSGPLIVVVRDGQGGVAWHQATLTVP